MKFSQIKEIKDLLDGADWQPVIESMRDQEEDFTVEGDGSEEYRFIHTNALDRIWEESLEEMLRDCVEVPPTLENYIDYEKWVRDCKYDGAGHHFSGYDGSELEIGQYHIFRTN